MSPLIRLRILNNTPSHSTSHESDENTAMTKERTSRSFFPAFSEIMAATNQSQSTISWPRAWEANRSTVFFKCTRPSFSTTSRRPLPGPSPHRPSFSATLFDGSLPATFVDSFFLFHSLKRDFGVDEIAFFFVCLFIVLHRTMGQKLEFCDKDQKILFNPIEIYLRNTPLPTQHNNNNRHFSTSKSIFISFRN